MTIVEATTPPEPIVTSEVQPLQHGRVTIIDGFTVVQSMGCDIANHFLEVVNSKSRNYDYVHVIVDMYDIQASLK
jgi:hypothetical protein